MPASTLSMLREKELLSLKDKGLLNPKDVVEFARNNPQSALHSFFNWNVQDAAMQHWLNQARHLIVSVTIVPRDDLGPVQAFVSLKSDRKEGGYRETVAVLKNEAMRAELLKQAFADFQYWEQKYKLLNELAPIFTVANKVMKQAKKRGRKPVAV